MAEEHLSKLQNAIVKSMDEIDKLYTRKVQAEMHTCAAKCCSRTGDTAEKVTSCIRLCSVDFEQVIQYLQIEYGQFLERAERCYLQCDDEVIFKAMKNPSRSETSKHNQDYVSCNKSCSNKFFEMIPLLTDRIKEKFSKKGF